MRSRIIFFLGVTWLLQITSATLEKQNGEVKFNNENSENWGSLSPEFELCSSGKAQSPVNIITSQAVVNNTLGPLLINYRLKNATLVSNGMTIEVQVMGEGEMIIDGKKYSLIQVHWHTPSEHHLNGIQYPAELHQVHRAADGSLAVIGTLYNYGNPDRLVARIQAQLSVLHQKHCGGDEMKDNIFLGKLDSRLLRSKSGKYYRYPGSLTTPPCTEHVTWTVMSKVKRMTKEQVDLLRAPLCESNKNNARPAQPLNQREVQLYDAVPSKGSASI